MSSEKGINPEKPLQKEEAGQVEPGAPILSLPPPESEDEVKKLEVGGSAIKLDALGPVIVNTDGTMRRIENWDKLSKHEQETTLRRIGKRNQERLKALQQQQEEKDKGN